MLTLYIAREIIEARINSLIKKRDAAVKCRDYDRAWKLNMAIDRNIYRLSGLTYIKFWA